MKIPRKKEEPEQPVIVSRITDYQPDKSNQAEELEVMIKNNV
jgi:hypothetical protein